MDNLKNIANLIMDEAKKYGVEYASCAVSLKKTKEFNVEVGEFTLLRTLFDESVGITIYKDKKHGLASVNSLEMDNVLQAFKDACIAAESSDPDEAWEIDKSGNKMTFTDGPLECDTDKLFMRSKELLDDINQRYPKLLVENLISDHSVIDSIYMNTYGNEYESHRGYYGFYVGYAGHEGEQSSHSYGSAANLHDLDTPFIELNIIDKELADTEKQAVTVALEDKFTGTVIFTPDCAADVIFGTIMANFVSDSGLIDDTSIWKDKLGEKVADPRIGFKLAPHDSRIINGQNFTGEGYLTEDYDVIEDGILKSFCLSQYGANKTGRKRSPNTSSAIICKAGEKSLEDIIKSVEKGIIIGRFSGGRPGANGEFSGIAKNAFLIENGEVTKALSETMISDNLPEMLFRLRDVSLDVKENGMGSVPYYAFDGITISGK
ncbi:MAG: TldD/PmbA family protein [Firmicutes bacterium]|nr:TldD/PmbA family protein [Bacillota bacterium]